MKYKVGDLIKTAGENEIYSNSFAAYKMGCFCNLIFKISACRDVGYHLYELELITEKEFWGLKKLGIIDFKKKYYYTPDIIKIKKYFKRKYKHKHFNLYTLYTYAQLFNDAPFECSVEDFIWNENMFVPLTDDSETYEQILMINSLPEKRRFDFFKIFRKGK